MTKSSNIFSLTPPSSVAPTDVMAWVEQSLRHFFSWYQRQYIIGEELMAGMAYATTGGDRQTARAKRLRPWLLFSSADILGVDRKKFCHLALAIEMIHGYSLVHDDLPAMDDDSMRRGQKTLHLAFTPPLSKKNNEALAILVGDILQTLAFKILLMDENLTADEKNHLGLLLAQSASHMVAGQWSDMKGVPDMASAQILKSQKTGAMLSLPLLSPCFFVAGDEKKLWHPAWKNMAELLGIFYQSADDILDEVAQESDMGKKVKKDQQAGKTTSINLMGLKTAQDELINLYQQIMTEMATAKKHLPFQPDAEPAWLGIESWLKKIMTQCR